MNTSSKVRGVQYGEDRAAEKERYAHFVELSPQTVAIFLELRVLLFQLRKIVVDMLWIEAFIISKIHATLQGGVTEGRNHHGSDGN